MATIPTKTSSALGREEPLEVHFRRLAEVWNQATAYLSSMSEASKHQAYQEIISLGPSVVPLLLRDMESHHTHWFIALREITGANPVPESAAGNVPAMVKAWSTWARATGYQW